jgi:hypothetical protein
MIASLEQGRVEGKDAGTELVWPRYVPEYDKLDGGSTEWLAWLFVGILGMTVGYGHRVRSSEPL